LTTDGSITCTNSATSFIDLSHYFSDSTLTSFEYNYSWSDILKWEYENPYIPKKVLHSVKPKIRHHDVKLLKIIYFTKQFTGYNFRIGKSRK